MKMPSVQQLDITCDCHDMMHRVVLEYDDEEMDSLGVYPMMNIERPWYKRIIPAMRFMLGLRGVNDWHYTDVVVSHNMVSEMRKFLEQYDRDHEGYWANNRDSTIPYVPARGFTRKGHSD